MSPDHGPHMFGNFILLLMTMLFSMHLIWTWYILKVYLKFFHCEVSSSLKNGTSFIVYNSLLMLLMIISFCLFFEQDPDVLQKEEDEDGKKKLN
jgi:hypothetical protein